MKTFPPTRRRTAAAPTLATAWAAMVGALVMTLAPGPSRAQAAAPCWAANVVEPVTSDNRRITDPRFAPLHGTMDTLEALARANSGLNALPEVRLRLKREINDAEEPSRQPYNASLHAHGFGPKAWGRGDCEVIPQADRLGARAGISFLINTPLARLNRWVSDEALTAYLEDERGEPMQGWPVFGGCAVITASQRLWWVPVSVGEMLDFYAREQQRRLDEHDRQQQRQTVPFDLAAEEARIAALRRAHGAAADRPAELALHAARQRKAMEPALQRQLQAVRDTLAAELDDLRATRAALSPEAAAAPYRLGSGRHRLPTAAEADRPLKRIVKLDPDFPWDGQRRLRVQAIQVCPSRLDHHPAYGPPMREAVRDLDFRRIAALLN